MTDISNSDRRKKIGERIASERRRKGISQSILAEKIAEMTGRINKQSTVSMWEIGASFPDSIDILFAMAKIFECDLGYLLCDYDERTHDSKEICASTGLSEATVSALCFQAKWGIGQELTRVIDALVYDCKAATKGDNLPPLVYLIDWYLSYEGAENAKKLIDASGNVIDCIDDSGYLPKSLKIDGRVIENAVLLEIQQALNSLKKRIKRRESKTNGIR